MCTSLALQCQIHDTEQEGELHQLVTVGVINTPFSLIKKEKKQSKSQKECITTLSNTINQQGLPYIQEMLTRHSSEQGLCQDILGHKTNLTTLRNTKPNYTL